MSIISHLLYDEQQFATYQKEAEDILCHLSGVTFTDAESLGLGRSYRIALTEVLRHLTLYDLYHEPALSSHANDERHQLAARAGGDILRKNGWKLLKETA